MHARHQKKKNFIAKLTKGDRIITSHEEKVEAVFDFYSNLIGTDSSRDRTINLDGLALPRHELDVLETSFSEEEVWNTIKKFAI
jgi:hypothetical protein